MREREREREREKEGGVGAVLGLVSTSCRFTPLIFVSLTASSVCRQSHDAALTTDSTVSDSSSTTPTSAVCGPKVVYI